MTDIPPRSPVPHPRPPDHRTELRQAVLADLAARHTPPAPPGPAAALTDQILVHTSWRAAQRLLDGLPPQAPGLILGGAEARKGVHQLHRDGYGGVLLMDPEGHSNGLATVEAPFVLPQGLLIEPTLSEILDEQLACGATVALTPTGYLRAGDSDALKTAADTVAALDRDDVLFSLPIDIAWLTSDHIALLIAVLDRLATPKAVFLGGQFDPLDRYPAAAPANLRRLVAEAGHVAVFRTDLAAFDAVTHGAFAASIGTGGRLRHVVPHGQGPLAYRRDYSPSVLYPDLMTFFKGTKIAKRFANVPSPVCSCAVCQDRRLDTFLRTTDSPAAHSHGVCTWTEWVSDMLSQATLADRAQWWRTRTAAAVAHYEIVNAQLGQPDGFAPPKALKAWASLPAWPSATEPAPRRSPTR